MNTNTNSRIANASNNNLNNNNSNNTNINTSIVNEDTSMNTNTNTNTNSRIVRNTVARRFAALLAFGGLLALSHSAAKADVVVDKFVGPQQTYGVAPGTTALQLKVRNTDGYTVSGVKIQTSLYKMGGFGGLIPILQASPASSPFSLAPYQSAWITIAIPAKSQQGQSLLGQRLSALAVLGSHQYTLLNFLNVPAAANVQPGSISMTGQNSAGADVFTVTFTNNGYVTSTQQTATVSTWLYGDGQIGQALNQTVSLPALAVGASYTVTLTSQATQGYDIKGYAQVGTGNEVDFEF